jgi:AN1-type zinc finger protein 5/6
VDPTAPTAVAVTVPLPAEAPPAADTTEVVEAVASQAEEAPEKPVQANRNRCFCCNKKVGLLGFECRCGFVFCSSHRHATDHSCTFDYASFDRERLAKANQKVEAAKVDKL